MSRRHTASEQRSATHDWWQITEISCFCYDATATEAPSESTAAGDVVDDIDRKAVCSEISCNVKLNVYLAMEIPDHVSFVSG